MEDLKKYNHRFEMNMGTKKLILDMIRSMRSLVPDKPTVINGISGYNSSFSDKYVEEVTKIFEDHEELFDGFMDPDTFKKYIDYSKDFKEIGDQLDKLLKSVRDYQKLAELLSFQLAKMIRQHIDMVCPGNFDKLDEYEEEHQNSNHAGSSRVGKKPNLKVV